jgi:hypothetical protein
MFGTALCPLGAVILCRRILPCGLPIGRDQSVSAAPSASKRVHRADRPRRKSPYRVSHIQDGYCPQAPMERQLQIRHRCLGQGVASAHRLQREISLLRTYQQSEWLRRRDLGQHRSFRRAKSNIHLRA